MTSTVPDVVPIPALPPFEKRTGERQEHHRALLLYAMQDPGKRKVGPVARALGRSSAGVRLWVKAHEWEQRLTQAGATAQAVAIREYQRVYAGRKSAIELDAIRPYCTMSLHPADLPSQGAADSTKEGRRGDPAKPDAGIDGRTQGRPAQRNKTKRQEEEISILRRGVTLTDALLATLAKDIGGGKVKVLAKDLPALLTKRVYLARDLERLELGLDGDEMMTPIEVPESYRVKSARGTGDPRALFQAIADDAHDLALTFRALANQVPEDREAVESAARAGYGGQGPQAVPDETEQVG